eukprot:CAMPEP_0113258586 /NCGR_PEP_ID=MMETSP0008_2-20120614/15903_1 /TAXON_ID=97485 /ORGANISM="Prymnesium parvum" /LENGTH=139 /DNA_ID=CAMNT_0000107059 /DNA_START=154 /DNA_END=573 /DNA_ORIENTATION=+ /assembly_acc=CAM_ASM_000153
MRAENMPAVVTHGATHYLFEFHARLTSAAALPGGSSTGPQEDQRAHQRERHPHEEAVPHDVKDRPAGEAEVGEPAQIRTDHGIVGGGHELAQHREASVVRVGEPVEHAEEAIDEAARGGERRVDARGAHPQEREKGQAL